MRIPLLKVCPLIIFLISELNALGTGEAWAVSPYATINHSLEHPLHSRSRSSAFEIHSVSGFGRPSIPKDVGNLEKQSTRKNENLREQRLLTETKIKKFELEDAPIQNFFGALGVAKKIDRSMGSGYSDSNDDILSKRHRRDTDTDMEKIASSKTIREARLSSPETWSKQPLAVEFRRRTTLDQYIQQQQQDQADQEQQQHQLPQQHSQVGNHDEDIASAPRQYQAPRADFVTSNHRYNFAENRESREMPVIAKTYEDYDIPWYRNSIRERDYDFPISRRRYNYFYPDRYSYRMERDYLVRPPADPAYLYDRYRDDDLDLYGRNRPTPKPKRIIYFATLPEVVRKPIDLRSYPRPYEIAARIPGARDGTYRRVPGNVDPQRYRYRYTYDTYDPYPKRSSFLEHRPYPLFTEEEGRRNKPSGSIGKENLRTNDDFDVGQERKLLANQATVVDPGENKLPWPVQIGTEVSVKEDERIPGRKIFGESNGYDRFQSAQLQKAPDATKSTDTKSTEE